MPLNHIPVPTDWATTRASMYAPAVLGAIQRAERPANIQRTKVNQTIQPDGTVTWTSNNVRVTLINGNDRVSFAVSLTAGSHFPEKIVDELSDAIATECGSRVETS